MTISYVKNGDNSWHTLTLNESPVEGKVFLFSEDKRQIFTNDEYVIHYFLERTLMNIPKEYVLMEFRYSPFTWNEYIGGIAIYRSEEKTILSIRFVLESKDWKHFYSINDFSQTMSYVVGSNDNSNMSWHEYNVGYDLEIVLEDNNDVISKLISKYEVDVKKFCKTSYNILYTNFHEDAAISIFEFPNEVKVVCEQYLLYFV